jgi:hypothetical protein
MQNRDVHDWTITARTTWNRSIEMLECYNEWLANETKIRSPNDFISIPKACDKLKKYESSNLLNQRFTIWDYTRKASEFFMYLHKKFPDLEFWVNGCKFYPDPFIPSTEPYVGPQDF